jgi:hypothetical protein
MIWALLISAVPVDPIGDPLERYLEIEDVSVALEGLAPKLKACAVGEDVTVSLTMSLSGDGSVGLSEWEPEAYSSVPCWNGALSTHRFPSHDDTPERVRLSLYVRGGALVLSPVPELEPRPVGPLLLFVGGAEDERSRIEQYIEGTGKEEQ